MHTQRAEHALSGVGGGACSHRIILQIWPIEIKCGSNLSENDITLFYDYSLSTYTVQ